MGWQQRASGLQEYLHHVMVDLRDPRLETILTPQPDCPSRADSLPLMSSIWPTALACLAYVYFCKVLGPRHVLYFVAFLQIGPFYPTRLMKDRKPFSLKWPILAYNLFQTMFSLWGFIQGWRFYVSGDYSWTCEPVDYSDDPEALRALNMAWLFYISKFFDFADSIFFVLKKKFSHLSFLHVFHHGIMPLETWWGPR